MTERDDGAAAEPGARVNIGPRRGSAGRFDRPQEPHDWRWVLGLVGRTLISIGVLLMAFVAYQLWGTGIQTAREQGRLRKEFDALLETTVPATTGLPTTLLPATTLETISIDPAPSTTTSPAAASPTATIAPPIAGDPVARLDSEAMGIRDQIVIEGISPTNLQDGPGHFPETPLPGQLGNAAIAGHRTTYGQPFRNIDRLQTGDDIVVTTLSGTYIYIVTGQKIVDPADYAQVIPTVDATKATLTLTSCDPPFSAARRIVVLAELDVGRSSPVTVPAGSMPEPTASTVPAEAPEDEQTATTTTTSATTVVVTTSEAAVAVPVTSVPANQVTISPNGEELFQNRWFSDADAFPQVALWGAVLTAIALVAHAASRRARRNLVGFLIGVVPFVVVLYFFFENVNRLLPPNL